MRVVVLLISILVVSCSSAPTPAPEVDPTVDPTVIGAIAGAAEGAATAGTAAADAGRRIGRVVGVIAAITGGPESEPLDNAIARYRLARDAGEDIGRAVDISKAAKAGAKRGYELDKQFAELKTIETLDVTRPAPYVIVVKFADPQNPHLADIARIVNGRPIDVVAPGSDADAVRDALIRHDVPASTLKSIRNDDSHGITLHIFMGEY